MAKLRKAPSDADGSLMSVGQTCFNDSQATAMFPPIATHGSPILSIIIILAVSWVLRTRDQTIQAQGNSFQKKVMLLFGAGHAVEVSLACKDELPFSIVMILISSCLLSRGFGFVDFESHEEANKAVQTLNGALLGPFELNDFFARFVPAIALLSYGFFHKGLVPGLCFVPCRVLKLFQLI